MGGPQPSRGQTDASLMLRVQADDQAAFGQLFERHWARSMAVARFVCYDRSQAEDTVQEAFLSMWRSRASYKSEVGSFTSWSTMIVRNRAIDALRRAQTRERLHARAGQVPAGGEEQQSPAAGPEAEVEARSEQESLWGSLKELPAAQAEIIALAFYGGLTHSEIASTLALPAGTVKGRMRLGLEKLRRALDSTPAEASAELELSPKA